MRTEIAKTGEGVHVINDSQQITERFRKREFVLKLAENAKYPAYRAPWTVATSPRSPIAHLREATETSSSNSPFRP